MSVSQLPTPPSTPVPRQLILCADGGGSKVCIVIRSDDGLEVQGIAGPCNVQSVGYEKATQQILLATYRALSRLPRSYIPRNIFIPNLKDSRTYPDGQSKSKTYIHIPASPIHSRSPSLRPCSCSCRCTRTEETENDNLQLQLPPLNVSVFRAAWLGMAGVSSHTDEQAFKSVIAPALKMDEERITVSNDVNLLAAPALGRRGIQHVIAVVAGTGTVGRTIRVRSNRGERERTLPLENVAISRGWGYLLCDEGSAFWLGRLAIRSLLTISDRQASSAIYSTTTTTTPAPPPLLQLHHHLLDHFGCSDPYDIITITSLAASTSNGTISSTSERNALVAGAARIVLRHAFPDDPHSHPLSQDTNTHTNELAMSISKSKERENLGDTEMFSFEKASHLEALNLTRQSIKPLIELTLSLMGDGTRIDPRSTALALGGGLMMSNGYRRLLLDGLRRSSGVSFNLKRVMVVEDPAREGVRALALVEFDK